MPLARRLRQMAALSWQEWSDLAHAAWELLHAHTALAVTSPFLAKQEDFVGASGRASLTPSQARLLDSVAWAIPRAAVVVPWRSDCLRQAEAARCWLLRHGVVAELRLGARKDAAGQFEAHAWLVFGEEVITGGDISEFSRFG